MTSPQPIEIVGGGLAGLSLGLALRKQGVPVTLFEAGEYPRHRVCGEFMAGLDHATLDTLGLRPFLRDARHQQSVVWFRGRRCVGHSRLPTPALSLSRYTLDVRLAEAFAAAGGDLQSGTRVPLEAAPPGRVIAAGRRREPSRWIGLKAHVENLALAADLELHMGDGAYVGACDVAEHRTNVCGLFRARADVSIGKSVTPLEAYLHASGLDDLANRIAAANIDPDSHCAVAALSFSRRPSDDHRMLIGDAYGMIPPFTGNGMAMALQSSAVAVDPLVAWAHGRMTWDETVRQVRRLLRRRFGARLVIANALHRFLYESSGQRWLAAINRAGLIPFRTIYHALH